MRVLSLGLVACAVSVACKSVGSYIATEKPIAKANLLANIGSQGSRAQGAYPGVVVASPSKVDPDYFYTWVRDSSLVFKVLVDLYTQGRDNSLKGLIDDFVTAEAHLQQLTNPSGSVVTGGLGEPKFEVNETAFTGSWGRPQRDGPALRSTTIIAYANYLLENGQKSYVQKTLWPIIKLDLDYVVNSWNLTGFDLWEEVRGASFFTSAAQHRSLRAGAALAKALGQSSTNYTTQASNVLCFLQTYWNPSGAFMSSNVASSGVIRSGLDSNTVLASIHNFDPAAGCDATTFQPCSDRALANLVAYVRSFASVYPINSGVPVTSPLAVGRYAEDVYYGGNPWYLSVFAVAEQLYDALYVWDKQGALTVTSVSQPFFAQFDSSIKPGTYKSSTSTYKALVKAIAAYADGYIALNEKYTPADGSLSEQFNRTTGVPASAVHLTWSYASALTAFYARDASLIPASWGAQGLQVPAVCQRGPPQPTATVTFNEQATTVQGEAIYIVGSVDELKNWTPADAVPLSAANYPTWNVTLSLPADTQIEYKYIRKTDTGGLTWESDPNRVINTPGNGQTLVTNDVWR